MTAYRIHTPRPALTPADILTRILFTFHALLAVLLAPRPAPMFVVPPWSERPDDPEWRDAIREMSLRMAPHHRAR